MEKSYYIILGVRETASPAEVRKAYHQLARMYHPDVSGSDTIGRFREIQEAWNILGDLDRRQQYDRQIRRSSAHPLTPPSFSRPKPTPRPVAPQPPRQADFRDGEADSTLYLHLYMSAAEAASGGKMPVDLPAFVRCPSCEGAGQHFGFLCPSCSGRGRNLTNRRFFLAVPSGLSEGDILQVPLEGLDLLNRRLVIHIVVGSQSPL